MDILRLHFFFLYQIKKFLQIHPALVDLFGFFKSMVKKVIDKTKTILWRQEILNKDLKYLILGDFKVNAFNTKKKKRIIYVFYYFF